VKFKPQPWQLIVLIAVICCLSVAGMVWFHSRTLTHEALLRRLPTTDATLVWIDFAALRRIGFLELLGGATAAEQPDYQSFVYATRFDYMNDLDGVLASFPGNGGFYSILEGRFDWKTLRSYVAREHGQCINSLCRFVGSTPEKHISFLPLRRDLMAMSSGPDAYGVNDLLTPRPGPSPAMPQGLAWIKFPGSLPKSLKDLPPGTGSLVRIIGNAPSATLSFVQDGDQLGANLEIECRSDQEATDLASEFAASTETARKAFSLEHTEPNPGDFSGIITSGVFRTQGSRLLGHWPISQQFIRNLFTSQ